MGIYIFDYLILRDARDHASPVWYIYTHTRARGFDVGHELPAGSLVGRMPSKDQYEVVALPLVGQSNDPPLAWRVVLGF